MGLYKYCLFPKFKVKVLKMLGFGKYGPVIKSEYKLIAEALHEQSKAIALSVKELESELVKRGELDNSKKFNWNKNHESN